MNVRESRQICRQSSFDHPEGFQGDSPAWVHERAKILNETPGEAFCRVHDIEAHLRNPEQLERSRIEDVHAYLRAHRYTVNHRSPEQLKIVAERLMKHVRNRGNDLGKQMGGSAMILEHESVSGESGKLAVVLFADFLTRECEVCNYSSLSGSGSPMSRAVLVDREMAAFFDVFIHRTEQFREWSQREIAKSYMANIQKVASSAWARVRLSLGF